MDNLLKEFRKAKGLTQGQLAELAGCSSRSIISIEQGKYKPSITLAYKLALLLDTNMEELFKLEQNIEREKKMENNKQETTHQIVDYVNGLKDENLTQKDTKSAIKSYIKDNKLDDANIDWKTVKATVKDALN
ncbi:MAG: helix-turn-helix transcriptional regulator [Micrococcaceae bacterium]